MWRSLFWIGSLLALVLWAICHALWHGICYGLFILVPLFLLGVYDIFQTRSNVLRNYPIVGHIRYFLLAIRPELRQYFFESNQDGTHHLVVSCGSWFINVLRKASILYLLVHSVMCSI